MSIALASTLLQTLAVYGVLGVLVAVAFLLVGAGRVDPAVKGAPFAFRLLLLPGAVALWPFLLRIWIRSRSGR